MKTYFQFGEICYKLNKKTIDECVVSISNINLGGQPSKNAPSSAIRTDNIGHLVMQIEVR